MKGMETISLILAKPSRQTFSQDLVLAIRKRKFGVCKIFYPSDIMLSDAL